MLTREEITTLPARQAYQLIVREVFDESLKTQAFSKERRLFILATTSHEEIRDGGIGKYFTDPSGRDFEQALKGLRALGANQQADIVMKWLQFLPPAVDIRSPAEVGRYIFGHDRETRELEKIDEEYFAASESFYQAIVDYVIANANAFGVE